MGLRFTNVEKRLNDSLIFPAFNLHIRDKEVTAVYSSLNVRETLLHMLTGKASVAIGEISIKDIDISKVNLAEVGFLFLDEGLYERLTVADQLHFYRKLYNSDESIPSIIRKVHLEEQRNVRTKKLSNSEQRRVLFAKLLIQNPTLFIIEEPDQNIDIETQRIFILIIERLRNEGKSVLILTSNMQSAITTSDRVFKLDESGLQEIQVAKESSAEQIDEVVQEEIQPVRFEKIPTKVNEKIVLFDPPEIDYIESNDGQTFLHIKGEEFPTMFTLKELEERLQYFGFFRCHRSYIVNLQKVREVITWTRNSYSLVLDDEEKSTIPLSKSKMSELKAMLGLK